jgi:hypothetical protein
VDSTVEIKGGVPSDLASKVAEEMRRSLSKSIAERNGTDHEAKFKMLSRHAKQREAGMKIRRVNKN